MTLRGLHVASHILSRLPTVGVFAKATSQDTPKAVVTKTDEPMRRFVLKQYRNLQRSDLINRLAVSAKRRLEVCSLQGAPSLSLRSF